MVNITYVCRYNKFRSFCAEYITKYKLKEKNIKGVNVNSFGFEINNYYRNKRIYKKLNEKFPGINNFFGKDPTNNIKLFPKTFTENYLLLKKSDLILCMENEQIETLQYIVNEKNKLCLLGNYSSNHENIIKDPGQIAAEVFNKRKKIESLLDFIKGNNFNFYLDKGYDFIIDKINNSVDNLIEKELKNEKIYMNN